MQQIGDSVDVEEKGQTSMEGVHAEEIIKVQNTVVDVGLEEIVDIQKTVEIVQEGKSVKGVVGIVESVDVHKFVVSVTQERILDKKKYVIGGIEQERVKVKSSGVEKDERDKMDVEQEIFQKCRDRKMRWEREKVLLVMALLQMCIMDRQQ